MNFKVEDHNNFLLVSIFDIRIDASISEDYKKALIPYVNDKPIILDLNNLEFIDSSGLSTFIYLYKQAKKRGIPFRLINVNERVMNIFDMTGLTKLFEIYRDLNDATLDLE